MIACSLHWSVPRWIGRGVLLLAALELAGCAPHPARPGPEGVSGPAPSLELARARVVEAARTGMGAPYKWGGDGGPGFDCSGLIQYAYAKVGISVPRTVDRLREAASLVRTDRVRPGDLLFFRIGGDVSHVGMYVGRDRFIHAPSRGRRVTFASLENPYWERHLAAAGNFF
ncbi:C40 family peptidase [Thiohalorhabdus sp. Cl-TMA]|uniref:C40 family peptidase n=1 Tax=Thiohalorhabdus methylotrophus TaxID=3242694 RepID=A0ABV4TX64_9GAMM